MGKKNSKLHAMTTRLRKSRLSDQTYRSIRFAGLSCVSSFYTLGAVGAKSCAVVGMVRNKSRKEQFRYYKLSGVILMVASLLYIGYSVWVCFRPATAVYNEIVAICIAAFTCAEMIVNIRGVVKERHNHTPLIHAVKMINLASAAVAVVLTQTALLSFSMKGENPMPWANGVIGILMGTAATVIGVIMIVRIRRIEKKETV